MSDQNKFEKMLELLVNEDKAAAEELFHEIVVEKSRDIYESLLEDEAEADDEEVDESDEDLDEADDEEVDESDEDLDENFSLDTFEVEADDEPFGGDKTDDLANDLGMEMPGEEGDDDMGDAEDDAGVEDRVEDLEDALDDLKAEFEKMMAGDDEGEDDGEEADDDAEDDMDMDAEEEPEEESYAFEAADEDDEDDKEVEEDTTEKSASETMREYVEKVTATMGDNGTNGKSAVAKPNNMGGTSGNLNQAGSDASSETGAGKKIAGSALNDQNAKDIGTGNVNVPGGKAAKAGKTVPAGHGAEKKGAGETADKAAGSTLNKLSKRAK